MPTHDTTQAKLIHGPTLEYAYKCVHPLRINEIAYRETLQTQREILIFHQTPRKQKCRIPILSELSFIITVTGIPEKKLS